MSKRQTDPATGRTTLTLTTDDYGRVRDTDGPRDTMANLHHDLAHLDDAIQEIAHYVTWARTAKPDHYRDMSVNAVPEYVLEASARAGAIVREVEALSLWLARQEQEAEDA